MLWTEYVNWNYTCSDNESNLTAVIRSDSIGRRPGFPRADVPTEIKLLTRQHWLLFYHKGLYFITATFKDKNGPFQLNEACFTFVCELVKISVEKKDLVTDSVHI